MTGRSRFHEYKYNKRYNVNFLILIKNKMSHNE